MGLYVGPLGIGEVGLVCSSHARYSTELLPPDYPFRTVSQGVFSEVHGRSVEDTQQAVATCYHRTSGGFGEPSRFRGAQTRLCIPLPSGRCWRDLGLVYPEMDPSSAASGRALRSRTRALDAPCNGGPVRGFLGSRRSPLGSSFCARKALGARREGRRLHLCGG